MKSQLQNTSVELVRTSFIFAENRYSLSCDNRWSSMNAVPKLTERLVRTQSSRHAIFPNKRTFIWPLVGKERWRVIKTSAGLRRRLLGPVVFFGLKRPRTVFLKIFSLPQEVKCLVTRSCHWLFTTWRFFMWGVLCVKCAPKAVSQFCMTNAGSSFLKFFPELKLSWHSLFSLLIVIVATNTKLLALNQSTLPFKKRSLRN